MTMTSKITKEPHPIEITMGDEIVVFSMPAGLDQETMADELACFIDNATTWGSVESVSSNIVTMFSRSFGEDGNDLSVLITPDSTMGIDFEYLNEVSVPALSSWGSFFLVLLMLSIGVGFSYYQRNGSIPQS